jgi:pyruvate-formate lyase-activating enzyme
MPRPSARSERALRGYTRRVPVRVGFVLPYGQRDDGFFPDTFLGVLCADARAAGHVTRIARVYYEGDRGAGDAEIARRLTAWLDDADLDLVVAERIFDPEPIRAWAARRTDRQVALVARGDSIEALVGVDLLIGAVRGPARGGHTRRASTIWQVAAAFAALLARLEAGADLAGLEGVARVHHDVAGPATPLPAASTARPLTPVLDHEVIALGPAPVIARRTIFGNAGCPYAADPLQQPLYRGLALPDDLEIARRGCAFCSMGGDYERRPDEAVIGSLVDQARHIARGAPATRALVLDDQAALRYLPALVRAAAAAGVPPLRWLFAARSDTFVRERAQVEAAIAAATAVGHELELYLTGFEAFSDVELARYNKGVTVADQLAAVAAMRALARAHPAFHYADARGHSLILWNPWTTPDDLADTIAALRAHGLAELFDEVGRNRLRLYPDLPIFHAAARDGALVDAWPPGDGGAGRAKGYHHERPWRFLDPRTHLAHALAEVLRARLGRDTELAQLDAIAARARAWTGATAAIPDEVARIDRAIARLGGVLDSLADVRTPDMPARGQQDRAAVVRLTGACNNGCATCPNREWHADDDDVAVRARLTTARASGQPIMFAGREPTLRADLPALIAAARGADDRAVGVVSNGRRFAYPAYATAARARGLTGASIKLFGPTAAIADAIARVPGAHGQALAGCRTLVAAGVAVELRAPLHAAALADPAALAVYADLARDLGATQLRIDAALDAIGLAHLDEAVAAIEVIAARCADLGLPLEVSPLSAGATLHDRLPARPPPRRAPT